MGSRGPKPKYEKYYDDIRRMYVDEHKTDEEIGKLFSMTANAVYVVRRKIGILSRRALGQNKKLVKPSSSVIVDAWNKSFEEHKYGKGTAVRGSATRVADMLGVSPSTAQQWLREEGLLVPRPKYENYIDKIVDLYTNQKKSVFQISQELNIAELTVSLWLKRADVSVISSQYRRTEEQKIDINRRISEIRKNPEHQEKIKQSNLAKFGREWPNQSHLTPETVDILSSRENLITYLESSGEKSAIHLAHILGCSYSILEHKMKKWDLWNLLDHHTSNAEIELQEHYAAFGIVFERTRKIISPYEIDLYSAEHRIGIEFNGDYWHSEEYKNPDYHQKKSLLAEQNGVFLYHIFEYEWKNEEKRTKILNQLNSLMRPVSRTIYARNTQVRQITATQKKDFLVSHHIQGNDKSSINYGLFCNDELISVMTFARPRFSHQYQWELSRLCTLSDTRVVGGASKLFSYFVKTQNPISVVSYSDIAKTRGGVYEKLGFCLDHISTPNYVWTDFQMTLTRYQTQMKNEREIMMDRGFVRIFDSGNKVWVWKP